MQYVASLKRKGIVNCSKILDYNSMLRNELYKYALKAKR